MAQHPLFKRHFQVAYVADDVNAAMAVLGNTLGIERWNVMDIHTLGGAGSLSQCIATAWVGDLMIELIQPNPLVPSIYQHWKTDVDQPLKLHHLGFLVDSAAELAATLQPLAARGCPTVLAGSFGEALDYGYADTTAQLGHYCEYIFLKEQGRALFNAMPRH